MAHSPHIFPGVIQAYPFIPFKSSWYFAMVSYNPRSFFKDKSFFPTRDNHCTKCGLCIPHQTQPHPSLSIACYFGSMILILLPQMCIRHICMVRNLSLKARSAPSISRLKPPDHWWAHACRNRPHLL